MLSLVYGSVALFLLVKVNGYIIGFDVLTYFAHAMCSVPDIQKIPGRIVFSILLGTLPWYCE